MDLLFGLDMLKAYQSVIDLTKNVLRIQDREVPFLAEHELPEKARMEPLPDDLATPAPSTAPTPTPASFPGGGNVIGSAPSRTPPQTTASRHSEESVQTLISFGVSREVAISTLDAAGGNLEVAASLLF